jgi:hypothetical protein
MGLWSVALRGEFVDLSEAHAVREEVSVRFGPFVGLAQQSLERSAAVVAGNGFAQGHTMINSHCATVVTGV